MSVSPAALIGLHAGLAVLAVMAGRAFIPPPDSHGARRSAARGAGFLAGVSGMVFVLAASLASLGRLDWAGRAAVASTAVALVLWGLTLLARTPWSDRPDRFERIGGVVSAGLAFVAASVVLPASFAGSLTPWAQSVLYWLLFVVLGAGAARFRGTQGRTPVSLSLSLVSVGVYLLLFSWAEPGAPGLGEVLSLSSRERPAAPLQQAFIVLVCAFVFLAAGFAAATLRIRRFS